jgi:DNA-binding MarR family transcriptional regulator
VDATASDPSALGAAVRGTVVRLWRRFRSERPNGELGDAALDVLTQLWKLGPRTLTELSDDHHVAPGSMSQSVNRLTASGYAERTPDPKDRRKVQLVVTPAGIEVAARARAARHAWLDGRLATLTAEERRIVSRACELLDRVSE